MSIRIFFEQNNMTTIDWEIFVNDDITTQRLSNILIQSENTIIDTCTHM